MRKFRRFLSGKLFPCVLLATLTLAGGIALTVWLPRALAPIAAAERLFSFATGLSVALSSCSPEGKTARFLVLLLLPWTGAVCCLLWGNDAPRDLPVARNGRGMSALCAPGSAFACRAERAEYFPDGAAMRPRFLADLAAARKYIYLEYYIVAEGAFWNEIRSLLAQRARAGVDVRLLYDGFGCALTLPRAFRKEMNAAGVRVRAFSEPKFPWKTFNRRDHRKIAVIDGKIAYTGGINLADEYVGETVRFGHWKDSAVRLCGDAAQAFSDVFLGAWQKSPPPREEGGGGKIPCAVFADDAHGGDRVGKTFLLAFFRGAQRTLYVNTPYLAPHASLSDALAEAAQAGADVRLMIPHIPDKRAVFALTRAHARKLAANGVKVREYAAGFLHAKSAVADGTHLLVGSYNLDMRSTDTQAECAALIEDAAVAADAERDFLAAWEQGLPVPPQTAKERLLCALLLPFSPLI